MTDLPDPSHAGDVLVAETIRQRIDEAMASHALVGGWLLVGPPHIGKATLAYQLAKTVLSKGEKLGDASPREVRLIEAGGHPDLFVVRRKINEKTGRLRNEIVVDDIRGIIGGLHRTATTGRRVAIVDTADDMNREAANALLKVLEEPPKGTLLLLLSSAPGRLLPTIRSRCRRLILPPVSDQSIADWLVMTHGTAMDDAQTVAAAANGRPGRARRLATGDGEAARSLAADFFAALDRKGDLIAASQAMAGRDMDAAWPEARQLILDRVQDAILARGRGEAPADGPLSRIPLGPLIETYDELSSLMACADALNSERQQTALTMGLKLRQTLKGQHAGR